MTNLAIIFGLICLIQFVIIILWRKPKRLFKNHKITKTYIILANIVLIAGMILFYILLFFQLLSYHKPHPLGEGQYIPTTAYPTPAPALVQQLGKRQIGPISNLYFFYRASDKSEATLTNVAFGLRQEYCKKMCIINIYDDKTAFERDLQRVTITSQDKMKEWNKKNYVFVADHYLGYLDAVQNASFSYYPFHDSYYQHAKAGTLTSY